MKHLITLLILVIFCGVSCEKRAKADEEPPKLTTITFANGKTLKAEVADTIAERAKGLMHRTSLPEGEAMLFIFQEEHVLSFWMKDTFIPLSIAFFDKNKKLINIEKMEPQTFASKQQDLRSYQSQSPALFAIEVNQGWFAKNDIKPGTTFNLAKPK